MKYKILIPQDIAKEGKEYLLERGYEIKMGSGIAIENIKKDIVDCDAVLTRYTSIPFISEIMKVAPKLKIISRNAVGTNDIDLEEAEKLGIWVTNCPLSNLDAVAECAIGMLISASRRLNVIEKELRKGNFEVRNQILGEELTGKVLGIVGLGKIGKFVAKRAMYGLEMKVIAYDPYIKQEDAPDGVKMIDTWENIFKQSDFISLHRPYTGEKLVGKKEFDLMKSTAIFMNFSRGEIVFENELIEALQNKVIAGAVLDVFENEPIKNDNPLLSMDNVVLTPHIAGLSRGAVIRMGVQAAKAIDDVFNGRVPEFPVNSPKNIRSLT